MDELLILKLTFPLCSSSLLFSTLQELQRFPRLHAQLIEVVSELLRERLGPTSEYVQSLISIQAAYINTNHPAFVQDSANIARQTREGNSQNRQQQLIAGAPQRVSQRNRM